jgi:tRNA threonylcarbamoyladenosine biosynthesis protein TsaE
VLVNVYRKPAHGQPQKPPDRADYAQLFHLDAYRLSSPVEATELDLEYYLGNGPLVIEWADRIHQVLPQQRLWINLNWVGDEQRDMMITAYGRRYQELLVEFRKRVYGIS